MERPDLPSPPSPLRRPRPQQVQAPPLPTPGACCAFFPECGLQRQSPNFGAGTGDKTGLGLEVGAPRQGLWPRSAAESEGSESLARFPNEEMQLGKAQQLGHPNLLSKVYKVSVLD